MIHDPVCGMEIKVDTKAGILVYNNKEYRFCSDSCKTKFLLDPGKYEKKNDEDDKRGHEHHHH